MTRVRVQLNLEIAQALTRARGPLTHSQMAERIRMLLDLRYPSAGTLKNWEEGIGQPPAVVLWAAWMIAEDRSPLQGEPLPLLGTVIRLEFGK